MVIFTQSKDSLYFSVNKSVQEELEKAIVQQQKNISALSAAEKMCKKKIFHFNRMIKGQNLVDEKKHASDNIQKYSKELQEIRKESNSSKSQLQRYQDLVTLLDKEIKSKHQQKKRVENVLKQKLHQNLLEQQREEKRIASLKHQLTHQIKSLQEEKKQTETKLHASLAELQNSYLTEKENKEKEMAQAEHQFNRWIKEKNSVLHQERASLKEIKECISRLNQEKEEVAYNLEEVKKLSLSQIKTKKLLPEFLLRLSQAPGEKDLAQKEKEDFLKSKSAIQNCEKEISDLKLKEQKLLQDLEKKDQSLKTIEAFEQKHDMRKRVLNELSSDLTEVMSKVKRQKSSLSRILFKISENNTSIARKEKFKDDVSKEVKKEITLLTSKYEKDLARIQSNNSLLREKIQHLQDKRKVLWKGIENRNDALNQIKSKVNAIDQKIAERRRIEADKTMLLSEEIKKIEKGVFEGEQKVEKIHHMLYQVKEVSSDLPAVIGGFRKEESKIKENLLQLKKELLDRKEEAASIKDKSANDYSQFLLQKNHLGLVQKKTLSDKQILEKNLNEITKSLTEIKSQIERETDKENKLQKQEHQETLQKQNYLAKEITEANSSLQEYKKELVKEVSRKRELVNSLHQLNEKKLTLNSEVRKNQEALTVTDQKIEEQKKRYSELLEEELFRQRLLKKIKQDEIFEDNYFQRLQQEMDHEAMEELSHLNRSLSSEKSTSLSLGHRTEQEKKQFLTLLAKKKKELLAEQIELQEQLPKNRKAKEEAILNQGKAHLSQLQQEMDKLTEKVEHYSKRLDNSRLNYEREVKLQRHDMFEKKTKINQELKKLTEQDFSDKKQLKTLQENVSSLNQHLKNVTERVVHAREKVERITNMFVQNIAANRELSRIVKDKLRMMTEQVVLREELHQLHSITTGKGVSKKMRLELNRLIPGQISEKKEMTLFLKKIDDLFGKLPKKEIDHFSKTITFKQYQKMMKKYGVS